jgi:uncharacterized protein DUF5658
MRRFLIVAVMGFTLISSCVFAADDETATTIMTSAVAAATSLGQRPAVASPINRAAQFKAPNRPMALPTLYAGSALLQGYDAYSTLSALKSGATEANPLMKGITKSPVAFIALKAGMTTAAILSAERMWKDDHRVKAVVEMLVSNGMMAAVAAHNASVLRQVQ